jgi:hypothetical protein
VTSILNEAAADHGRLPLFVVVVGAGLIAGKIAGPAFFIIDVAATAEQTYRDVQRFNEGEIGAADLAIKLSFRGANLGLAYRLAFTDPEPVTHMIAATATTAEQTYRDVQRFNEGEIGATDLAIKLPLRGANLGLAYVLVFTDPEPITKAISFVGLVVVISIDVAHDAVIDARVRTARRLLDSIDREEREHAVRHQLLQEFQRETQGNMANGASM